MRRLAVFGLSLSSSWGNGHAITYRGLLRELAARGWQVTFLERDVEWYRSNRDTPRPSFCELVLYEDWRSTQTAASEADVVLLGSYVPDGQAILDWLHHQDRPLVFYDIDTPITLTALNDERQTEYLRADQVPMFESYLSFTGGPALHELETVWGARHAEALYCGVDTLTHRPAPPDPRFVCALGYMGTYAPDRQPLLQELLVEPARSLPRQRFLIAGAQYPEMSLPPNVEYQVHLYPRDHAAFYCSNRVTLNLTRAAMRRYGWSPSTRLFEAAACGACIVSDTWPGLEALLAPDDEVLLAESRADVLRHLTTLSDERRQRIGEAARRRVLAEHTYQRRAAQLEAVLEGALAGQRRAGGRAGVRV
jgi:spore maturation protein CgeB